MFRRRGARVGLRMFRRREIACWLTHGERARPFACWMRHGIGRPACTRLVLASLCASSGARWAHAISPGEMARACVCSGWARFTGVEAWDRCSIVRMLDEAWDRPPARHFARRNSSCLRSLGLSALCSGGGMDVEIGQHVHGGPRRPCARSVAARAGVVSGRLRSISGGEAAVAGDRWLTSAGEVGGFACFGVRGRRGRRR
jgi:hypothetical protein